MSRKIIAEIGINHDGEISKAKELIDSASRAGCHAIKFQYRNTDRMYSMDAREIGDEIIHSELKKSRISIEDILKLSNYAKDLDLEVGISCFTVDDFRDFEYSLESFDFLKVPSVELSNFELVDIMLGTGKMTYISLGAHSEAEIESSLNRISSQTNWIPMHCISNYPTALHNAKLGYISLLQDKWKRPVGFSSHDDYWELTVAALTLGAQVIERHITYSKDADGLDHSTSSTHEEFSRLCMIASEIDQALLGNFARTPNQGELLNRQNLGRSYYAKNDLQIGDSILFENFDYRNPQIGLTNSEFKTSLAKKIVRPLKKGAPLSRSHIEESLDELSESDLARIRSLNISLPVRLHDYSEISAAIPINAYEFHLSFEEVANGISDFAVNPKDAFSVHIPDYLDSNTLMDPFSSDQTVRSRSLESIDQVMEFASELSDKTKKDIPIVGSFTGIGMAKSDFYQNLNSLLDSRRTRGIILTAQWLPPFAWYFGGSIKLEHLTGFADLKYIEQYGIPLTMDVCHLLLGTYGNQEAFLEIWGTAFPFIKHVHVADALGLDGEGVQIGEGKLKNPRIIQPVLQNNLIKVLEVWQGHLDNYSGFKRGLLALSKIENSQ